MSILRKDEIPAFACDDCACSSATPPHGTSKGVMDNLSGRLLALFGMVLVTVVVLAVFAEWLGLFDALKHVVPWPVWLVIVISVGYPIFQDQYRLYRALQPARTVACVVWHSAADNCRRGTSRSRLWHSDQFCALAA